MSRSAYVVAWEPRSGKSLVVLGLMELLSRRVERLAYFRPLVEGDPEADPHLRLVRERYRLATPLEQMVGVRLDRAEQMTLSRDRLSLPAMSRASLTVQQDQRP